MKFIKLTKGFFVEVSDSDFEFLNHWKWHVQVTGRSKYAARSIRITAKKIKRIFMHRQLLTALKDEEVDHRDGNGLNNRRENIRLCNRHQNAWNSRRPVTNTSGYKGVHWRRDRKTWVAIIYIKNRGLYLGSSSNLRTAAKLYDEAAVKFHGSFANLNFPTQEGVSIS